MDDNVRGIIIESDSFKGKFRELNCVGYKKREDLIFSLFT